MLLPKLGGSWLLPPRDFPHFCESHPMDHDSNSSGHTKGKDATPIKPLPFLLLKRVMSVITFSFCTRNLLSFVLRFSPDEVIFAVLNAVIGFFRRRLFAYHRTWYRRTIGKSVWHSSSQCAGWPSDDFEETSNPGFGVCPECMRIEHRDLRFFGPTRRD